MNFSNEMLFMTGLIIAIVILIQYLSFVYIKKQIKIEIVKRLEIEKNHSGKKTDDKDILVKNNDNKDNRETKDKENESYDIDTPEDIEINGDEDADSYVNPLKSVKGDDNTEEDK
jgi:hypothetical protein